MSGDQSISQTGMCHCEAVQFKVEGQMIFNAYCHCKNCVRNRGVGPVHCIGVAPNNALTITQGKEHITTYGEDLARAFCRHCGCVVYQAPQGQPFVVVLPFTFHIQGAEGDNNGGSILPEKYRAKCHINYESRMLDCGDNLTKFKGFPHEGVQLDNRGVEAKGEYVPVKDEESDGKISQTGMCHCEAVKYTVEGNIMFSMYCHCKNCVRNRGAGPLHGIGVTPEGSVKITEGAHLTTDFGDEKTSRVFCNVCGCVIWQGPKAMGLMTVCPATFHLENPNAPNNGTRLLPKKYRPTGHVNYESRLVDWDDNLPKWKGFNFENQPLHNDGSAKEAAGTGAAHTEQKYCENLKCLNAEPCPKHTKVHLYGFPASQPFRSCLLLVNEARIPFEFHLIRLGPDMGSPDYRAINPAGAVPALVDGDLKLSEGAAILVHLAETRHLTKWYPSDPKVRAKVNQWLHWHHSGSRHITLKGLVPIISKGDKAASEQYFASDDFAYIMRLLEHQLTQTPYLAGNSKTIADLFVLCEVDQLNAYNVAPTVLDNYPKTKDWLGRLTRELASYPANVQAAQEMARALIDAPFLRQGAPKAEKPLVAVLTASSNTGGVCAHELLDKHPGVRVRCVFRSENKTAEFKGKNAEIVTGVDASQPETLAKAFQGAHTAVIVTPHDDKRGMAEDARLTAEMINAAAQAGVKHIVYLGSWTVEAPEAVQGIAMRFVPSEALLTKLAESGGPSFTSLRLGFFNQNLIDMWAARLKSHNVIAFPEVSFPPCDTDDMGRCAAAVAAVGGQGHQGKFYNISGPEVLNNEKFAAIFSKVLGREIKSNPIPVTVLKQHVPDFLYDLVSHMNSKGDQAIPFSDAAKTLTGHQTPFEDWLRKNKHHFE